MLRRRINCRIIIIIIIQRHPTAWKIKLLRGFLLIASVSKPQAVTSQATNCTIYISYVQCHSDSAALQLLYAVANNQDIDSSPFICRLLSAVTIHIRPIVWMPQATHINKKMYELAD